MVDAFEPGERLLWQEPVPGLLDDWPNYLGQAFVVTAIALAVSGEASLKTGFIAFGFGFVIFSALGLIIRLLPWIDNRAETQLTNRRLLQRDAYTGGTVIQVPLAEVAEVKPHWAGGLTLAMVDGSTLQPRDSHHPQALAAAMSEAAGLPAPHSAGRLAGLWNGGHKLGIPFCIFLGALLLINWVSLARDGGLGSGDIATWCLWFLGLFVAATFGGLHFTAILGLVVLRPWVSTAEARTWLGLMAEGELCRRPWERWSAHLMLWRSPFYGWLVRLLWGAPKNRSNVEAGANG